LVTLVVTIVKEETFCFGKLFQTKILQQLFYFLMILTGTTGLLLKHIILKCDGTRIAIVS